MWCSHSCQRSLSSLHVHTWYCQGTSTGSCMSLNNISCCLFTLISSPAPVLSTPVLTSAFTACSFCSAMWSKTPFLLLHFNSPVRQIQCCEKCLLLPAVNLWDVCTNWHLLRFMKRAKNRAGSTQLLKLQTLSHLRKNFKKINKYLYAYVGCRRQLNQDRHFKAENTHS